MPSKQLKIMKRQIAHKMVPGKGGGRKAAGFTCPHCHGYHTTKEGSHDYFIAKRDKKKLPFHYGNMPAEIPKDRAYAKMPMSKFLRKYPEWKP